jgi:hypothetical protein
MDELTAALILNSLRHDTSELPERPKGKQVQGDKPSHTEFALWRAWGSETDQHATPVTDHCMAGQHEQSCHLSAFTPKSPPDNIHGDAHHVLTGAAEAQVTREGSSRCPVLSGSCGNFDGEAFPVEGNTDTQAEQGESSKSFAAALCDEAQHSTLPPLKSLRIGATEPGILGVTPFISDKVGGEGLPLTDNLTIQAIRGAGSQAATLADAPENHRSN